MKEKGREDVPHVRAMTRLAAYSSRVCLPLLSLNPPNPPTLAQQSPPLLPLPNAKPSTTSIARLLLLFPPPSPEFAAMTLRLHNHHLPRARGRRLTSCHRHPDEPFSTLCAACLRERLSLLNPPPPSSAAAAVSGSTASSGAALPELRRCRTVSSSKRESVSVTYEPRRRSCEVRGRSTLEDLFAGDGEDKSGDRNGNGGLNAKSEVETNDAGILRGTYPVPELSEEEFEEIDCEIRVSGDLNVANNESAECTEELGDSKTMKEFIDLESKSCSKPVRRDFKEIAGSFRIAASVFGKKLQKWKRKQQNTGATQSEVGEYGLGRRSCDNDPRISIDLGRASVDGTCRRFDDADPRCSLDLGRASVDCGRLFVEEERYGRLLAPRASCDGYMNGKPNPQASTPMVSVIENAMATVYGFDDRAIAIEKLRSEKPHSQIKILHEPKLLITEKELMNSRMSSLKDDATSSTSSSSSSGSHRPQKWRQILNIWPLLTRAKNAKSTESEKTGRESNSDPSWKLVRSSSVASTRNLCTMAATADGIRAETEARFLSLRKHENGDLRRHGGVDEGMLRFYLTPLRSYRRSKLGRNWLQKSPSLARTDL